MTRRVLRTDLRAGSVSDGLVDTPSLTFPARPCLLISKTSRIAKCMHFENNSPPATILSPAQAELPGQTLGQSAELKQFLKTPFFATGSTDAIVDCSIPGMVRLIPSQPRVAID
jgi:hypothetical protein